jgi:putative aminopeptidase FrvX
MMIKMPVRGSKQLTKFLLEVTSLPVAAGHEGAAIRLVESWVRKRRRLALSRDKAGNLVIARKDFKKACRAAAPLFITAHLDHPAFVVLSTAGKDVKLEFRGGVQDAYFKGAAIEIFDPGLKTAVTARIAELDAAAKPFKTVMARLAAPAQQLKPGCIGRWKFPPAAVKKGVVYTHACDDLAGVAAALAAYDGISKEKKLAHTALLFTRAEEVGFVGAIGAARGGTIPKNARLICLECSRSFPHDSPIGGGPIVRVGDRMSVFTPELTNAVSNAAAAYQKASPAFSFQRKLMPGGVCEASAFSFYGLCSTCLCLPLGNYHNMADIDGVAKGKKARVGQEYVSVADFHGLVELLGVIARGLDAPGPSPRRSMEKIWADRAFVVAC